MRVLLTGARGQLARALGVTVPAGVDLLSVDRTECDITKFAMVGQTVRTFRPEIIINTAAYTAVDAAEENEELAFRINAGGTENLARAAELVGARLIHISTDYVFDGHRSTPYPPEAPTNPLNVYGASKLEGERLALLATSRAVIVRAGWLYSEIGKNFLVSIMTSVADSRPLSVVSDQVGCPTSAHEFACAIWRIPGVSLQGIYHWANTGSGSWYDFAREIIQTARQLGLLRKEPELHPVTTQEYRRPAHRPAYSVLDSTRLAAAIDLQPSSWQEALRNTMARLPMESRER